MILVADSGSTKCDWMFPGISKVPRHIESMGFNPLFHKKELIVKEIRKAFKDHTLSKFSEVYFYGAACSNDEPKEHMRLALAEAFPDAVIHVSHDLEAAAIATCGNKEGIACILGTGSNACFWNGKAIQAQIPSFGLGYVLGDEGSGMHMGKMLLRAYFYNDMPINIRLYFESNNHKREQVIEHVYTKPNPNVYLASYTRFLADNINFKYIESIVLGSFREFFQTHIVKYGKHKSVPVNFVGSVAFVFQNQLQQVAREFKVQIGTILKQPIQNLFDYHLQNPDQPKVHAK